MNLRHFQGNLPWSIPYSAQFNKAVIALPHLDMQHAVVHVMKSMGKLCSLFDKMDHQAIIPDGAYTDVPNLVADLVMCAARMANVSPWGKFDLEDAVRNRTTERNGQWIDESMTALPEPNLHVGDRVEKTGGDYSFKGEVVCVFRKRQHAVTDAPGPVRVVVENDDGILHIYSEKNLVKVKG